MRAASRPWARALLAVALSVAPVVYGWAVFAVETDCLQEFLTCTYARVPAGAEMAQVDLDAELAALLEGGFPESGRSAR